MCDTLQVEMPSDLWQRFEAKLAKQFQILDWKALPEDTAWAELLTELDFVKFEQDILTALIRLSRGASALAGKKINGGIKPSQMYYRPNVQKGKMCQSARVPRWV